ncbi:hypothetical protein SAMN04487886_103430 [Clostridium sp. DSM 8431]|uniref:phosphoribosyltransferase n=1 Tax=Clostridium sp. DSM 8431 TaxID=1761781 RepID=UPI0008EC28A9|nr:phosphoribosyltransferase [Clostridium sp. DSM 8431]SFU46744.1 hypothetical protein SAMN04487886_103430 [Clostridium sp. DSM 8431]
MLNKSNSGIYYLNESNYKNIEKGNFTKDTLGSILALRDNKEEAVEYYSNLLEETLKDYNLEDFDILTTVPTNDGDNISQGMMKLLQKLSGNHENLNFKKCLNRDGGTINICCDDLKDKNIIIFDYFLTKGTSLNACKETLKKADANLVVCIALEKSSN